MKDTRFMQNYFFFFFYLTRLAHAGLSMSSVAAKVHVCVFRVALLKLGTRMC